MAKNQKELDYIEAIKNSEECNADSTVLEKLSRDERECHLFYNEAEGVWYAESSIPKFWRRLEKKNWECVDTQYYADGTVCSKFFKGSKKGVTITDPFKKRELTDEQRASIRQRFLKNTDVAEEEDDNDEDNFE